MAKRQKPRKRRPESIRKGYKAQQARAPMLQVRVPRALYTALQAAAKADQRTLADWLRLNLPRLLALKCGVAGDPPLGDHQGPLTCELPKGHEGYHRSGAIAWLGYYPVVSEPFVVGESSDPPTGEPK